jgi:hypothetical protein
MEIVRLARLPKLSASSETCSARRSAPTRTRRRRSTGSRAAGSSGTRRAVALDGVVQLDAHALRLRQLAAADRDEAVGPDRARQLDAGAHQERRPVDAVEARDVLADDVEVGRPPVAVALVGEADGRQVVRERVEPDVDGVRLVARPGDAPRQARARHGDVLQPALEDAPDLVAPALRLDELGALLQQLEQPVLVARQPEEPVLLLRPRSRASGASGSAAGPAVRSARHPA